MINANNKDKVPAFQALNAAESKETVTLTVTETGAAEILKSHQASNLPQNGPSVTVFNTIKRQLAVLILFIPTIWLCVELLIEQPQWQWLCLLAYSVGAAGWLITRTRKLLKEMRL